MPTCVVKERKEEKQREARARACREHAQPYPPETHCCMNQGKQKEKVADNERQGKGLAVSASSLFWF